MTTFSQLVDDLVVELLRPDLRATIAVYTQQTIRDIHFRPSSNSPILYDANRFEDLLSITSEGTWNWTIPSNTRFQDVEAIYIDTYGVYVPKRNPRVALQFSAEPYANLYWYRSGPVIAIAGLGTGMTGKISYHMYPQNMQYKAVNQRLIKYNPDLDSYTLSDGSVPSESQLALETNWVLQRWPDAVKEGVRAKAWKRLGEMERTRIAFSAFESMRTGIWNAEPST